MVGPVVLVTGVSRPTGARLAAELAADDRIARVIGVDTLPPGEPVAQHLGGVEFVRADIRSPLIATVIDAARVGTVVHLPIPPGTGSSRSAAKEVNVIGTMQLLAAAQNAAALRRLVVCSTSAVYGHSPSDPATFGEDTEPHAAPRSGFPKDAVEIEGYVRGFGRRRPDVSVTLLRLVNVLGPTTDSPLTRYLSLPVVPTVFGYDPRLQFVHEDDVAAVLHRAARRDGSTTVNVAGDGVLTLSQVIRRAGRIAAPVPGPGVGVAARLLRQAGRIELVPEPTRFLNLGRVVDTSRLHREFGYRPRYSSAATLDEFIRARGWRNHRA